MDRRAFLRTAGAWIAGLLGAGLTGCGAGAERERIAARARSLDPNLDCTDVRGLWPAEVRTRTDNAYVNRSERAGEYCFACANFIEPAVAGACGTCRTVKGPINPGGWCKSWTKRTGS